MIGYTPTVRAPFLQRWPLKLYGCIAMPPSPFFKERHLFPAGIWCQNDVVSTSMRRNYVASTLIRRHFRTKCPLGCYFLFASLDVKLLLNQEKEYCPGANSFFRGISVAELLQWWANSIGRFDGASRFLACNTFSIEKVLHAKYGEGL